MLQSLHYQAINEVVLVVNKPDRFLFVFCSMCQRTRATRTQWGVPSCIAPPSARPRARPCTAMTSPEQTGNSFWLWSPALERTLKSCKEKVLHPMTSDAHSDVNLYFSVFASNRGLDASEALQVPGVVDVITAKDIPGKKVRSMFGYHEELLAQSEVVFSSFFGDRYWSCVHKPSRRPSCCLSAGVMRRSDVMRGRR